MFRVILLSIIMGEDLENEIPNWLFFEREFFSIRETDGPCKCIARSLLEILLPLISGEDEKQAIPTSLLYEILLLYKIGLGESSQFIPRLLFDIKLSTITGEDKLHNIPIQLFLKTLLLTLQSSVIICIPLLPPFSYPHSSTVLSCRLP